MQRADAVFEGGGVKGVALVGALQALEEADFRWQNVAGTSAGAIVACLVAVGYSAGEIRRIMDTEVDFARMKDADAWGRVPLLGPALGLFLHKGIYRGDYLLDLMRSLVREKTGEARLTFGDLTLPRQPEDPPEEYERKYKYRLQVIASDLTRNEMLVLPYGVARSGLDPDSLEVALAVRMSMSIPFFFRPAVFRDAQGVKHYVVDGGILSNFPVWLFDSPGDRDPAWPTIGFLLWEPGSEKPREQRIRGPFSMLFALFNTLTSAYDRKALAEADSARIIRIPTGRYSAVDFDITQEDRNWLFNSGYQAGRRFLEAWRFDDYVRRRREASAQEG